MGQHKYGKLYRSVRKCVRFFLPEYEIKKQEDITEGVVFVSHHQNLLGPVIVLAEYPHFVRTWALDIFFDQELCRKHYVAYTFTERFKIPRVLAKIIAWPFSSFVAKLMKSGRMIPVHRQSRKIIHTLQTSAACLAKGENLLVFPDIDYSSKEERVGEIYSGFLSLEKYYYRKTGRHLSFVPLYADERTCEIKIGQAIQFTDQIPFMEQKEQVAKALRSSLNELVTAPVSPDSVQVSRPESTYSGK